MKFQIDFKINNKSLKPFAEPHSPAANNPKCDQEDHKASPGTYSHQCFQYKTSVKIDSIESSDASGRGVCE